ncbi:MAG TPA: SIMPL domain-containing protein [Acidimicrobiales bacterium]|nr:SIMPL domain-containing protein [Acidimicrobiales bacterium]
MSDEPIVAVRGEAVLEVEPEIARVGVTVTARDADRAKAMHLLNERVAAIDEIVAGFGDAIEDRVTTGVRVSPSSRTASRASGSSATWQRCRRP